MIVVMMNDGNKYCYNVYVDKNVHTPAYTECEFLYTLKFYVKYQVLIWKGDVKYCSYYVILKLLE